jgi:hypothetical protein
MSLSLDMSTLFSNASTIVNALWPIVGISAGFSLGFGILAMVVGAIGKAVRG